MQACSAEAEPAVVDRLGERRLRRRRRGNGGFGGGGGGFRGGGANRAAFAKCLPASLQRLRTRFTSPSQTLRQVLNPPQTNITTTAYTIGGVDQTHPTMGVVTTAQVTKGRFLAPAGGHEALVSTLVRREALAESRLEARPERNHVHRRRSRQPAARRSERRRLPAAEAAADAREREGPRERRARSRDEQLSGRRR